MAKRRKYGDYCEYIDGELYASVSIPIGNGKYKRKRKKVDSKTDARNWALAELDKAKHGIEGSFETFSDLAEWFKKHFLVEPVIENDIQIEGSKDWKKNRAKLDRISQIFGYRRINSIKERDLLTYSRERREIVTQSTVNRDLALLRTMFRKGREADPSIIVPKFPILTAGEKERDRVMSFDEERRILAACEGVEIIEYVRKGKKVKTDKHRTNRTHLKPLVIIAVDTAMRMGEILKLKASDLDIDTGVIHVRKEITKTGRARKVPMTSRVKDAFLQLPRSGNLFSIKSCYGAFKTACDRAKVKGLNFHDLRHTATTRMIRAGIPYMEVMKITGHTQIKTFLRYLNPEDVAMQTAASRLEQLLNDEPKT